MGREMGKADCPPPLCRKLHYGTLHKRNNIQTDDASPNGLKQTFPLLTELLKGPISLMGQCILLSTRKLQGVHSLSSLGSSAIVESRPEDFQTDIHFRRYVKGRRSASKLVLAVVSPVLRAPRHI